MGAGSLTCLIEELGQEKWTEWYLLIAAQLANPQHLEEFANWKAQVDRRLRSPQIFQTARLFHFDPEEQEDGLCGTVDGWLEMLHYACGGASAATDLLESDEEGGFMLRARKNMLPDLFALLKPELRAYALREKCFPPAGYFNIWLQCRFAESPALLTAAMLGGQF